MNALSLSKKQISFVAVLFLIRIFGANAGNAGDLSLDDYSSLALANLRQIDTAKGTFSRESLITVKQSQGEIVNHSVSEVHFVFKGPNYFKFIQSVTREDRLQSGPSNVQENLVTVFTPEYSMIHRIYQRGQDTIWISDPQKIMPGITLGDSVNPFSEGLGFHTYVPISAYVSAMKSSEGATVIVKSEGQSTIDGKECVGFVVDIEQKGKNMKTKFYLCPDFNGGIVRSEMVQNNQIVETTEFDWKEAAPHIWMWSMMERTIGVEGVTALSGKEKMVIKDFQVNLPIQEEEFELSGLKAKPGTKVHDEIMGTDYKIE